MVSLMLQGLSKEAFRQAVGRSPMLEGAWGLLEGCDANGAWVCVAPELDEETVGRLSTRDSTCPDPIQ